ncbi:unnamed protein product, partial [Hapterophycus canaliculatus]
AFVPASLFSPVVVPKPIGVCSNGIPGIQSGSACCLTACGGCGGLGCGLFGGRLGPAACCQIEIEDAGELCSVAMEAPCVVDGKWS